MHRVFLFPEYPPAAEGWKAQLPDSIHIETDAERHGCLRAVLHYDTYLSGTRVSGSTAAWLYEYDANGRILKIEFPGHRDLSIFSELYNAILTIGLFAQNAPERTILHFNLQVCAKGLMLYFDAEESRLRSGLIPPFPSPML